MQNGHPSDQVPSDHAPSDKASSGQGSSEVSVNISDDSELVTSLAIVQAVYELEISHKGVNLVLSDFIDHFLEAEIDGINYRRLNRKKFTQTLSRVLEKQARIDQLLTSALTENLKFDRLDSLLRAILRAGCCELIHSPSAMRGHIISRYLTLSDSFYDTRSERQITNAVLDKISHLETAAVANK